MRALADLMYPEPCIGCGILVRGGLCKECTARLNYLEPPLCGRCGAPGAGGTDCGQCWGRVLHFDRAMQCVAFRDMGRAAVLRLKYRGQRSLAEVIARLLVERAAALSPRALTWVPTDPGRLARRGFDQAALITIELARLIEVPCAPLLHRVRKTVPQVGLDTAKRRENLMGAFRCRIPSPSEVCVVDDVYTTGASMSEAARALKAAGAQRVMALAFARTE